ncbi:MAG: formate dehydrogenase accessory protein FdhE [Gemmataceae bacterium]
MLESVAEALADLSRLEKRLPTLASSCAVLGDMLPALFGAPILDKPPALEPSAVAAKLEEGVPLLQHEKITLDNASFQKRWLGVCRAIARQNPDADAVAHGFVSLDPPGLLQDVFDGRPEAVAARADERGLNAALTATVLRLTAFPVLVHFAAGLQAQANAWRHGYCPICGSVPLLGEFRGLEQLRFLRCGLCAAQWQFSRLRCPACGAQDHKQLGFLQVEGEENHYRAATCDACHGYVKMISTLAPLTPPQLLVADLATLHLDLMALERGFGGA